MSFYTFDKNLDLIKEKKEKIFFKNQKKSQKNSFFTLAKYASIGYYFITPLLIGVFLGLFLENLLNKNKIFFIMGFSIGFIGLIFNFIKILKDIKKDDRDNS